jgi:hypothetical protein
MRCSLSRSPSTVPVAGLFEKEHLVQVVDKLPGSWGCQHMGSQVVDKQEAEPAAEVPRNDRSWSGIRNWSRRLQCICSPCAGIADRSTHPSHFGAERISVFVKGARVPTQALCVLHASEQVRFAGEFWSSETHSATAWWLCYDTAAVAAAAAAAAAVAAGAGVLFGNSGGVMEAAVRTVYEVVTGKVRVKWTDLRGGGGLPLGWGVRGCSVSVCGCGGGGRGFPCLNHAWQGAGPKAWCDCDDRAVPVV